MQTCYHSTVGAGSNGFTDVPFGLYFVNVRETGGTDVLATLGPLTSFEVTPLWVSQGTYITLQAIESNDPGATYECQLDSQPFVPCKW